MIIQILNLLNKDNNVNNSINDLSVDQKLISILDTIREVYNIVSNDMIPIVVDRILLANISTECMTGLAKSYSAFINNEKWIFQMIDSNGHLPSGLMSGTLTALGDYDQCLAVQSGHQSADAEIVGQYSSNSMETLVMPQQLSTQIIINALLSVDTFFFISGFLVVYLSVSKLRKQQNNIQLNFPLFLALRWLRFAPFLAAIMSINFLWPLIGTGPFFHQNYIKHVTDPCVANWWTNFLFISNWLKPIDQCMIHTWYLSADFQLYLLAYVIIKLYLNSPYKAMIGSLCLSLSGVIIAFTVNYLNQLPPSIIFEPDIK
ncbi:nose resistant to fluoxetine protein 6-like [Oppia nitens]|uniref:nose resistant to fluoxetine protein 6-like n=1 Tax=Oppia nitens TaxID=1686743 RepID=UPI0023DB5965|nr:nose resistant to fluoxetine protein 6-like [Oppia nitens]